MYDRRQDLDMYLSFSAAGFSRSRKSLIDLYPSGTVLKSHNLGEEGGRRLEPSLRHVQPRRSQ